MLTGFDMNMGSEHTGAEDHKFDDSHWENIGLSHLFSIGL